jgi:spore germination cell wall hydrolase CwlJ-like protein
MRLITLFCYFTMAAAMAAQSYQEKIVAAVLTAEAATEGKKGMLAVAEVVHTRASRKGKTPLQIVTAGKGQKRAFSCLNGTTPDKLFKRRSKEPAYPTAVSVARVLCQAPQKLTKMTKNATHYTRKEEKPYWSRGRSPVAIIGAHAFYKLPSY